MRLGCFAIIPFIRDLAAVLSFFYPRREPIIITFTSNKNPPIISIEILLGGGDENMRREEILTVTNEIGMRRYRTLLSLTVHMLNGHGPDRGAFIVIAMSVFPLGQLRQRPHKRNLTRGLAFPTAPTL